MTKISQYCYDSATNNNRTVGLCIDRGVDCIAMVDMHYLFYRYCSSFCRTNGQCNHVNLATPSTASTRRHHNSAFPACIGRPVASACTSLYKYAADIPYSTHTLGSISTYYYDSTCVRPICPSTIRFITQSSAAKRST